MALARSRQAARRVKDRWKAKQWYKIQAPIAFNEHVIGETMSDEPEKVIGRTAEATLHDLTGDMRQMHVKLYFRVSETVDSLAKTDFIGHSMSSDYVRRLTRRGQTKISAVFDVKTKDGSRLRVKPFAVTDRRAQTTAAQAIRAMMQDIITKAAAESTLTVFLKAVLVGDLSNAIYKEARKIHPVRRVEIAKTEIVKAPTLVDETPVVIIDLPSDEEEVAEGEEGVALVDEDEDGEAVDVEADSEEE